MTVVFDAEALVAFAFDEPGADVVERYLDDVYDGERDGYVTTINLAEFRYVAARKVSLAAADEHATDLRRLGLREYGVDDLWVPASTLKATYGPALGDAYALTAARELDGADRSVTLLVGADDDYDEFETVDPFASFIERFRDEPA